MTSNTNNGIIWTEEKTLELIRKFKTNPVLWDTKNPLFYKQEVKIKVWESIGKYFNVSGKACKHKMSILMSSFRREKSRIKKGLTSGYAYKSNWFAYNEMRFMLDKKPNNEQSTAETNPETEYVNVQWEPSNSVNTDSNVSPQIVFLDREDTEDFISKVEPLSDPDDDLECYDDFESNLRNSMLTRHETTESGPTSTKKKMIPVTHITGNENDASQRPNTQQDENPVTQLKMEDIKTFCNFLQAKLKKYPEQMLNEVQRSIYDIIYETDKNYYNNPTNNAASGSTNTKCTPSKRKRMDSKSESKSDDET